MNNSTKSNRMGRRSIQAALAAVALSAVLVVWIVVGVLANMGTGLGTSPLPEISDLSDRHSEAQLKKLFGLNKNASWLTDIHDRHSEEQLAVMLGWDPASTASIPEISDLHDRHSEAQLRDLFGWTHR